ncbi:hypothetical protein H0264_29455 [Nocardia huaxiensis]|uniref:Uncharacterized protein n=1 Tax=Nocardia huaxiensis TaxID=2755382 RepID=A0A7D6Z0E4_9NOCA|nr:hypothetical protein [Nocardia huaxiensis]QLY29366.1 hypothetical protein H0264_29455 [Nocardia huaxiensis]
MPGKVALSSPLFELLRLASIAGAPHQLKYSQIAFAEDSLNLLEINSLSDEVKYPVSSARKLAVAAVGAVSVATAVVCAGTANAAPATGIPQVDAFVSANPQIDEFLSSIQLPALPEVPAVPAMPAPAPVVDAPVPHIAPQPLIDLLGQTGMGPVRAANTADGVIYGAGIGAAVGAVGGIVFGTIPLLAVGAGIGAGAGAAAGFIGGPLIGSAIGAAIGTAAPGVGNAAGYSLGAGWGLIVGLPVGIVAGALIGGLAGTIVSVPVVLGAAAAGAAIGAGIGGAVGYATAPAV